MLKKIISFVLSFSLIISQPIFAQGAAQINLGNYLRTVGSSMAADKFRPLHMRYFSYDVATDNFQLLLDKGDNKDIKEAELQEKTKVLMEYFQIGLALPNEKFWVNLRPDAQDQIIDPELEKTDMGRIMLEADLQLKKDTAGLTSPQNPEGKAYWDKLYKKAGELFGSENITIPTITRPWIVPGEIILRQGEDSAYIFKANMKVMLEHDYLNSQSSGPNSKPLTSNYNFSDPRMKELNEYSSQLIRELIIPRLTKEVNSSKRYASLRQVFFSLVMARWFKDTFGNFGSTSAPGTRAPENFYVKLVDSGDLTNLTSKEAWSKTYYFNEYKKSFEKGEYNLKEDIYTPTGQVIRSYVSGGTIFDLKAKFAGFVGKTLLSVLTVGLVGWSIVFGDTALTAETMQKGNQSAVVNSKSVDAKINIASSKEAMEASGWLYSIINGMKLGMINVSPSKETRDFLKDLKAKRVRSDGSIITIIFLGGREIIYYSESKGVYWTAKIINGNDAVSPLKRGDGFETITVNSNKGVFEIKAGKDGVVTVNKVGSGEPFQEPKRMNYQEIDERIDATPKAYRPFIGFGLERKNNEPVLIVEVYDNMRREGEPVWHVEFTDVIDFRHGGDGKIYVEHYNRNTGLLEYAVVGKNEHPASFSAEEVWGVSTTMVKMKLLLDNNRGGSSPLKQGESSSSSLHQEQKSWDKWVDELEEEYGVTVMEDNTGVKLEAVLTKTQAIFYFGKCSFILKDSSKMLSLPLEAEYRVYSNKEENLLYYDKGKNRYFVTENWQRWELGAMPALIVRGYFDKKEAIEAARKVAVEDMNVKDARNFDMLYAKIEQMGGISGTSSVYNSEELIKIIESVRKGKKDIVTITRSAGLRSVVEYLLLTVGYSSPPSIVSIKTLEDAEYAVYEQKGVIVKREGDWYMVAMNWHLGWDLNMAVIWDKYSDKKEAIEAARKVAAQNFSIGELLGMMVSSREVKEFLENAEYAVYEQKGIISNIGNRYDVMTSWSPGFDFLSMAGIWKGYLNKQEAVKAAREIVAKYSNCEEMINSIYDNIKNQKSSSSLSKEDNIAPDNAGGIDFRHMNYLVQPMGSFKDLKFMLPTLSSSALERIDLDKELESLRDMVKNGMVPSGMRVKEYLAACFQKGKIEEKQDDLLVCLAEIYRLAEEENLETSPELRESLVIVDTGKFVLLPNNQKVGLN